MLEMTISYFNTMTSCHGSSYTLNVSWCFANLLKSLFYSKPRYFNLLYSSVSSVYKIRRIS